MQLRVLISVFNGHFCSCFTFYSHLINIYEIPGEKILDQLFAGEKVDRGMNFVDVNECE